MMATGEARDANGNGASSIEVEAVAESLPAAATSRRLPLDTGETLDLLAVPLADDGASGADLDRLTAVVRRWVGAAAPTTPSAPPHPYLAVPLYGCEVVWTPGRAAVVGPASRVQQLQDAVVEFATREAQVRDLEHRAARVLEAAEADAAGRSAGHAGALRRRAETAAHYQEAVALGRRLALLAPVLHAPPLHPPTLASQVGERLRERARLAERHEAATSQAELAERVAEACSHVAIDLVVARRQMALEWAIVVLLVLQTVMLVVDLLRREGLS